MTIRRPDRSEVGHKRTLDRSSRIANNLGKPVLPSMDILEPNRSPPESEMSLAPWMLEHRAPGAREFVGQLAAAEVMPWRCPCGCGSINFQINGHEAAPPVRTHPRRLHIRPGREGSGNIYIRERWSLERDRGLRAGRRCPCRFATSRRTSAVLNLARDALKDPHICDFLGLPESTQERDIARALTLHITRFQANLISTHAGHHQATSARI